MYAIVDLETTGGRFNFDRIIEVGIVVYDGQEVIEEFESLVHPERRIPPNITRITGINNEMVQHAPKFYEIAKKIVQMTEGRIFVAHNVRFDYQFLRHEFQRLGFSFKRKQLCTVRLSKKVFPKLRSHSLDAMTKYLGIEVLNRHRALDDAKATVILLKTALEKDKEREAEELINLGVQESKLPPNISLEKLHELPEACGVYYFHNRKGDVIYIGKSVNIKKRIMQHFANTTDKANRMHAEVHEYTYEITGSELVAKLYESHLIKTQRPKHNRAQRAIRYPYCIHTYTLRSGYRCLGVAKTKQGLDIVTEFPKMAQAKSRLKGIVRRFNLCERYCEMDFGSSRCFRRQINECLGACNKEEAPETYNERVGEAIEKLKISIEDNILVMDEGRHPNEYSVIMVEDGHYRGFGFVDGDMSMNLEELKASVKPYKHNPEVMKIIDGHLRKNTMLKVFKW